eukprot:COSAG03_NODE_14_length_22296_cov_10.813128_7_plen_76_part_00
MRTVALTALLWVASATARVAESAAAAPRHVIFFLVDVRAFLPSLCRSERAARRASRVLTPLATVVARPRAGLRLC